MEQSAANGNGSGGGNGGSGSGGGSDGHGGGASKRKSADISNSDMVSSNSDMVGAKRDCCTGAAAADDLTARPSQGMALFEAAAAGDVAGVMAALLKHPGDAKCRDASNRTPLQVAVSMNAPTSVVGALLEAGAAGALNQSDQQALLQRAVATLNVETIEALAHLERPGATVLYAAAIHGTNADLAALLEDSKVRNQVNTRHLDTGETPLLAAFRGNAPNDNIEALLDAKASPLLPDTYGTTPLMSAVYYRRTQAVGHMLGCLGNDREFALNGCSGSAHPATLLHLALGNNSNDGVVEELIRAKADPTLPGTQYGALRHPAPLIEAVTSGNADFVRLVAKIVGPDALITTTDPAHGGLLQAATKYGHVGVVQALLDGGCDVNHSARVTLPARCGMWTPTVKKSATALWIACFTSRLPIIQLLIDANAKPTMEHLQLAVQGGNLPVLKLLLEAKVDPTMEDESTGCTPRTALVAAVTSSSWYRANGAFDPAALELMMTSIVETEAKKLAEQVESFKTCTLRPLDFAC